jgi:hypothetical protein
MGEARAVSQREREREKKRERRARFGWLASGGCCSVSFPAKPPSSLYREGLRRGCRRRVGRKGEAHVAKVHERSERRHQRFD